MSGPSVSDRAYAVTIDNAVPCQQIAAELRQWILRDGCREMTKGKRDVTIMGKGSYGTVFKIDSFDFKTMPHKCDMVIKEIKLIRGRHTSQRYMDELRRDTDREVRVQRIAADANISPKIWDYFECRNIIYIIMGRLPEGQTLYRWMNGSLPMKRPLRDVVIDIIESVNDLHALGYIHGDLHSGNIWVTNEGKVLIYDFGFAKSIPTEQQLGRAYPNMTKGHMLEYIYFMLIADWIRLMWTTEMKGRDMSFIDTYDAPDFWVQFIKRNYNWELLNMADLKRKSQRTGEIRIHSLWTLYLHAVGLPKTTPLIRHP